MEKYMQLIAQAEHDYTLDEIADTYERDTTITESEKAFLYRAAVRKYWDIVG